MNRIQWKIALAAVTMCVLLFGSGCLNKTRTVYVKDGDIVRLGKDLPNVPVFVQGADGKWVPSKMTLEEGWYCGPKPK